MQAASNPSPMFPMAHSHQGCRSPQSRQQANNGSDIHNPYGTDYVGACKPALSEPDPQPFPLPTLAI